MVRSHSTQAYVVLLIHCRTQQRRGSHYTFQVILGHRKEYGLT